MTILRNSWLPDAGSDIAAARTKFFLQPYMIIPGTPGPGGDILAEIPGTMQVVADPLNNAQYCILTRITEQNIIQYPGGVKSMINPITPTAADPITDWVGSAASRRWHRFAFMVNEWEEEPQILGYAGKPVSQLAVIWQLHEKSDTTPADTAIEPPIWMIDDGFGNWSLRNHYATATQTTINNCTRRELIRIPRRLNVWEEFTIYIKESWTAGEITIWHNNNRIFEEINQPNCFNNDPSRGGSFNFIEYGVYGAKAGQVKKRTIYHKGTQIGDEAYTTYDQFMIACGSTNREELIHSRHGSSTMLANSAM